MLKTKASVSVQRRYRMSYPLEYYKRYEPIFGEWYIIKEIGEGSFGKVFEIQREDFGTTYKAALKVITIPKSETEYRSILDSGFTEEAAKAYFRDIVSDMAREFSLMSTLKGHTNIVGYENHKVYEHEN